LRRPSLGAAPVRAGAGLVVAVLLVALNLRIAVTSLGALLDRLGDQGVGATTQSVLSSLPVLCFAVVGATALALTRRVGAHRGLGIALAVLVAGLVLRVVGGTAALVAGTLVACAGIALANVLIPVVVKEHFPDRVGAMTGAYSGVLSVGSALGAALTVPIADAAGGWRAGLGSWTLVAVAAAIAWAPYARRGDHRRTAHRGAPMWRSPTAWAVTVLFGTQSIYAYVMMGWLPSMYHDAGFSDRQSGLFLAACVAISVPVFLLAPSLAGRLRHQGHLVAVLTVVTVLGFGGMWLDPVPGAWVWAALIGAGSAVFPVVLAFFGLRTMTAADTATLSGMAQSIGYLIAWGGTFLTGVLHDVSGSWSLPLVLLVLLGVVQTALGYVAGRPVRIST